MAGEQQDVPSEMPNTYWMDGILYPSSAVADTVRKLPHLPVYDDDVYVTAYPKSGSIWTMTAIEAILRADDLDDMVKNGVTSNRDPLEMPNGYKTHMTYQRPRIVHTHVRYHHLPRDITNKQAKIVHVMRNPRDVAVSLYHFVKINTIFSYKGSWETFFDDYMDGHVPPSRWYDYMVDWAKYKEKPNILFIKYEDFIENPGKMIQCLAGFLGKTLDDESVSKITEMIAFKSMKGNSKLDLKSPIIKGDFLRKGVVGDWVNYFTPEQEQRIDDMYQKFKSETGVEFDFVQKK